MAADINSCWLPHLPTEVVYEARGYAFDAYLVALEGWRRGLTLKWHARDHEKFKEMKTWNVDRPGKLFTLSSPTKSHYFFRTRGDLVTNEAVELASDKEKTKEILKRKDVNVAEGRTFTAETEQENIVTYINQIGFPIVIKPVNGSFGRDVYLNINHEQEALHIINNLIHDSGVDKFIVEHYYVGDDYRLYVVGDKIVAGIKRIPPNIVGDGVNSIKTLIDKKNELRKQNPRLVSCLIEVTPDILTYLEQKDLSLDYLPEKGETVFLSDKCNISIGGDSFDVFEQLSQETLDTAVQAVKAVPNLHHGAVDLIYDESNGAVVLELNPTAQIGSLLFPMHGHARDVPAAIIDYYFPETKHLAETKSSMYFDVYDILEPLAAKVVTSTTVSKPYLGQLYGREYIVSGDVQQVGYHRGIRKQAFERKVSGFIKSLENGQIQIVIVGTDRTVIDQFSEVILADPERSTITDIVEKTWNDPVKIGFEIKADFKLQLKRLKIIGDEMKQIEREVGEAEKIIQSFHKSNSWRITGPMRLVGSAIKIIKRTIKS